VQLTIRDFAPSDQLAVRSLIEAGLHEHWGEAPTDRTVNADLVDLAASYAGDRIVVAVDRERVVGCGIVRRGAHSPAGRATAMIVRMSVDPSQRMHGIGRAVLEELVETARVWNVERVVLETTSTWTAVVRFYERCGFVITHHTDGPFGRDTWFERRLDP
jgi:GNAT superfamily N-acetyltransferase